MINKEKQPSKKLDRVIELLTEKFIYAKDAVLTHKRETAYVAGTMAAGIFGYALTGTAEGGLGLGAISAAICLMHETIQKPCR